MHDDYSDLYILFSLLGHIATSSFIIARYATPTRSLAFGGLLVVKFGQAFSAAFSLRRMLILFWEKFQIMMSATIILTNIIKECFVLKVSIPSSDIPRIIHFSSMVGDMIKSRCHVCLDVEIVLFFTSSSKYFTVSFKCSDHGDGNIVEILHW